MCDTSKHTHKSSIIGWKQITRTCCLTTHIYSLWLVVYFKVRIWVRWNLSDFNHIPHSSLQTIEFANRPHYFAMKPETWLLQEVRSTHTWLLQEVRSTHTWLLQEVRTTHLTAIRGKVHTHLTVTGGKVHTHLTATRGKDHTHLTATRGKVHTHLTR